MVEGKRMKRVTSYTVLLLLLLTPLQSVMACPVCFGQTESGSEVGLNAAVWVMVGITGTVLSLISALFLRFRRRMRMTLDGRADSVAKN